jgi:hypothetical protein
MDSKDWNCEKVEELCREPSVQESYERLLEEGNDDYQMIGFYSHRYGLQVRLAIYMRNVLKELHG